MIFSVFVDDHSPISSHIGIFRNYKFFTTEKMPHLNLAMELHGFAVVAAKQVSPKIEYMVTNPASKMQALMIAALKEKIGEQIWVGDGTQRMKRQKEIIDYQHDQTLFETYKDRENTLTETSLNEFQTLTLDDKADILKDFNKVTMRAQVIHTYLATHTSQQLQTELQKGGRTKVQGLYQYLACDHLLKDVETRCATAETNEEIENAMKENIRVIVQKQLNEFIYDRLHSALESTKDLLAYYNNANKGQLYLPEDLTMRLPLDHLYENKWVLNRPDESQVFARPAWFGTVNEKGAMIGGHEDLLNHLPTVIVSIPALMELWEQKK